MMQALFSSSHSLFLLVVGLIHFSVFTIIMKFFFLCFLLSPFSHFFSYPYVFPYMNSPGHSITLISVHVSDCYRQCQSLVSDAQWMSSGLLSARADKEEIVWVSACCSVYVHAVNLRACVLLIQIVLGGMEGVERVHHSKLNLVNKI